jgi:hypothetical protein
VHTVRHTVKTTLNAASTQTLFLLECKFDNTSIEATGSKEAMIEVIYFVTLSTVVS